MLADRVQEHVELSDVVAVALAPGQLGVQVGQVALDHRSVDAGQRGDVDALAAQPPFDQLPQPWLQNPGEDQLLVAGEPETAHLPHIATELGLPAPGVGEIADLAAGVDQQRPRAAVLGRGPTDLGSPLVLVPVQQRHRVRRGQQFDQRHDHRRCRLRAGLVAAALQRVPDLQTQLPAEPAQPDDLVLGGRDLVEPADEGLHVGLPVGSPGVGVAVAERQRRLRPQLAVIDPADRAGRRWPQRRPRGSPVVWVGRAGAVPPLMMELTQSAAGGPKAAAEDPAPHVRALSAPPWIGSRGELAQVGVARADPPQVMTLAEAVPASRPRTRFDPAGTTAEHRVLGGKHEHIGAELRSDRADQPLQHPTVRGRRPGRCRRVHSATVLLVNQPACSSTWRASSTFRCP